MAVFCSLCKQKACLVFTTNIKNNYFSGCLFILPINLLCNNTLQRQYSSYVYLRVTKCSLKTVVFQIPV